MLCIMGTSWKFESYTVFPLMWGNTAEVPVKYLAVGITGDMHSMCN